MDIKVEITESGNRSAKCPLCGHVCYGGMPISQYSRCPSCAAIVLSGAVTKGFNPVYDDS